MSAHQIKTQTTRICQCGKVISATVVLFNQLPDQKSAPLVLLSLNHRNRVGGRSYPSVSHAQADLPAVIRKAIRHCPAAKQSDAVRGGIVGGLAGAAKCTPTQRAERANGSSPFSNTGLNL